MVKLKKVDKVIAKDINKVSVPKDKPRRYVAERNVDRMTKDGWKVVEKPKDKHNRELGVRTNTSDLVLMEK